MNRKVIIVVIALVLVITILGIVLTKIGLSEKVNEEASVSNEVQERTVVINYNPDNYASAVFQIAKEKGLFEEYLPEGVTVEWTTLTSASDIRDAMVAGQIDIGTPGIMAFMTAIDNDMPLTLMSFYGYATVKMYTNDETINSISDFSSGDQISISGLASNPQAAFIAALKEERIRYRYI